MATLSAVKFDSAGGAEQALDTLVELQKQELITIHDGALVTWESGTRKPKTRQLRNLVGAGALGGMFWGMLFGLIFFIPLLGAAIGAGMGALSGALSDVGISNDFIEKMRAQVTEGTSALVLLTSNAVQDRVLDAMRQHNPQLIATNLPQENEDRLREFFADQEV